jgi:hypothetical protein
MIEVVTPQPQFLPVSESAALAALDDPDPTNPIALEIARLVTAYSDNFRRHVEGLG